VQYLLRTCCGSRDGTVAAATFHIQNKVMIMELFSFCWSTELCEQCSVSS